MVLVIGLGGRMGAGKGTIAEYLKREYAAEQFTYSDILSDLLDRLYMQKTRENLQRLGASLREALGGDVLVNAMREEVSRSAAGVRLIDGLRYVNEVEMLRSFPDSVLIFVEAPLRMRYERVKKRAEKGEGGHTLKWFREREAATTEAELDDVRGMADHILVNTGTVRELHAKVDEVLDGRQILL